MQGLAAVSILLLVGISLVLGIRLLALWSRTRGLPELLLGGTLLLTAGIGYPGQIVSSRLTGAAGVWLHLVAYVAVSAGIALLYLFTWRVFRAQAKWALLFACAGTAALGFNAFTRIQQVAASHDIGVGAESLIQGHTVAVAYLWIAWESLHHHALMKRRIRLGLADPVLASRFLLWGGMSLSASAGTLLNSAAVGMGVDVMHDPLVLLVSCLSGVAQAWLLFLALMPPKWYLARVRSRAASAGMPQGA